MQRKQLKKNYFDLQKILESHIKDFLFKTLEIMFKADFIQNYLQTCNWINVLMLYIN